MKIYLTIVVLFVHLLCAGQQQPVITLYVDPDCHNCQYVIQTLASAGIEFHQHDITDSKLELQMWDKLESIGVQQMVMMPVVLVDDAVVFPVYENGKMQRIAHPQFFPKLIDFATDQVALPYAYAGQNTKHLHPVTQPTTHHNYKQGQYYVVASVERSQQAATKKLQHIQQLGHTNAHIINQAPYYKIVANSYDNYQHAITCINTKSFGQASAWVETTSPPVVTRSPSENTTYHIILYSFTNADNANRAITSLHQKGYKQVQLLSTPERFRVSLISFASLKQVYNYWSSVKITFPKSWLIKIK